MRTGLLRPESLSHCHPSRVTEGLDPSKEVSMPASIKITTGTLAFPAELNDSPTAEALKAMLPLDVTMSRWARSTTETAASRPNSPQTPGRK
jgi:hypothetical protein